MLRALEARDFVILEKTSLEFGPGFSVLTGETGAGKSILVDAIELLVGGRGDGALVREGAERAELSAEFEVEKKSPLIDWLAAAESIRPKESSSARWPRGLSRPRSSC